MQQIKRREYKFLCDSLLNIILSKSIYIVLRIYYKVVD